MSDNAKRPSIFAISILRFLSHLHFTNSKQQHKTQTASTSAVSVTLPLARANQKRQPPTPEAFFKPLPMRPSTATLSKPIGKFQVRASLKEKAVTGLSAAAMTASMIGTDVAEAASGVSPSPKNFLLSIVAGGVVPAALVGAVIAVANFDPVKRS